MDQTQEPMPVANAQVIGWDSGRPIRSEREARKRKCELLPKDFAPAAFAGEVARGPRRSLDQFQTHSVPQFLGSAPLGMLLLSPLLVVAFSLAGFRLWNLPHLRGLHFKH